MQPRILYPARLLFRIEREIKSFQDRQKLKEYVTMKPALQEISVFSKMIRKDKMDERSKDETTIHQNPRGDHNKTLLFIFF